MQRIQNIADWQKVEDGKALNMLGGVTRRVRLDVNAPDAVRLWFVDGDGQMTFLARVVGRDVLEFVAGQQDFAIIAEGGECWFQSVDGENLAFSIPDAVTMTKLIERRPRNHEMELMMYMQNQNLERRLAQQANELEALWNRREAVAAAAAAKSVPSSADKPDPAKPEPAGTAESAGKPESTNAGNGSQTEPAKAK